MNTLLHGDCLELMKQIPDGSVDMILTDPPYGTTACKWDNVIPFEPMWEQIWRVLKPNGACLLFGCQPFTSALGASQIEWLRYAWVWEKAKPTNFANAKIMPLKGFEDILVWYRLKPYYQPQGLIQIDKIIKNTGTKSRKDAIKLNNDLTSVHNAFNQKTHYSQKFTNYPRGIIKFSQEAKSFHPTQKPVALLEYLIKTYTLEGETVLDFTMGSGSTGVACMNTGRKFIGIEMDDKYFEIASKRIAETKPSEELF
jgi:site-specific DNA-methyltransferase (adenine-specific)